MKAARFLLALCLAVPGQAASPARAIDRLLASSPAARGAFWGIQVTDLKTGRTLYQLNADRLFVPASNTSCLQPGWRCCASGRNSRLRRA